MSMKKISYEIETLDFECKNAKPLEEEFAFGLFFNSSEERSLEYKKLLKDKAIKYSLLIDFEDKDSELKKSNLEENKKNLLKNSQENEIILIPDIFDYQNNLNLIVSKIPRNVLSVGAKFFMDITGAPLIYSVALLRYFKLSFPCPSLYLLNVSGVYQYSEKPQFSEGKREDIFIPGYFGKPDHSKPQLYVFLLGYEGERSLNILKTNDPDFVEVIIPDPGYEAGNPNKTIRYNKDFLKETEFIIEFQESSIPNNDNVNSIEYTEKDCDNNYIKKKFIFRESPIKKMDRIASYDPEKVCMNILSIYNQHKDIADIRLVPLGTKPHAIGAGLAALMQDEISIMYQTPKKYSKEKVLAGDKMWIYIIK